jgi:thiol-disulfide isomerase/thioredoxin
MYSKFNQLPKEEEPEKDVVWFEINNKNDRLSLISPHSQQKTNHVCVIDNYTNWCGPCKMIANDYSKLAKKYTNNNIKENTLVFGKEDADKRIQGAPEVRGVPSFHFYVNGKYIQNLTVIGADLNQVEQNIQTISKKINN